MKKPISLHPNNGTALVTLDPTGGGINVTASAAYVKFNDGEYTSNSGADFKIYYRTAAGVTKITSSPVGNSTFTNAAAYSFTISETSLTPGTIDADGYAHYLTTPVTVAFTGTGNSQTIQGTGTTGEYYKAWTPTRIGKHKYSWEAYGDVSATFKSFFEVKDSKW